MAERSAPRCVRLGWGWLAGALLVTVAACGAPAAPRERDTAAEARRDRIAEARAESPIGTVGAGELELVDAFLQWRAEWDASSAEVVDAIEARSAGGSGRRVELALTELADEAADLAAIDRRGIDATVATWVAEIAAGYERQVAAIGALADAEAAGASVAAAQAEVVAAYDDTVALELRLLREVAEWLHEDAPAGRARLHEIADAIERETGER